LRTFTKEQYEPEQSVIEPEKKKLAKPKIKTKLKK